MRGGQRKRISRRLPAEDGGQSPPPPPRVGSQDLEITTRAETKMPGHSTDCAPQMPLVLNIFKECITFHETVLLSFFSS